MAIISGKGVSKMIVQDDGTLKDGKRNGFLFDIKEQVMSVNIQDGLAPIDITAVGSKTRARLDGVGDFSLSISFFIDSEALPSSNSEATTAPAGSAYQLLSVANRRAPFKFAMEWSDPSGTGVVAVKHENMRILDGGLSNDAEGNLMRTVTLSSAGGDPEWGASVAVGANATAGTGTLTIS